MGHRCGGHQGHVKEESQKVMVTIADPETGVYAELDGLDGNAVVRRHAWQPTDVGPDVILATTDANGTSLFLHDANKSVMQATGGNGEALGQCAYAPFGEPLGASPARIGFSSELFDASTRLAYYNYRHLAPGLGRWLGRDAIEEEGGVNLYAFINNNAIDLFDLLGLERYREPNPSHTYNKHKTIDEAIRKRMNYINDRSRNKDREYCGMVCKERLCKTNEIVYLTTQVRGNKTDCEPKNAPCPRFTYPVAVWHTHGKDDPKYDNEHFSPDDFQYSNDNKIPIYLITPSDKIRTYDPKTKKKRKL